MHENDEPLLHWCEVCGIEAYLTPAAAFDAGWDFPPAMGEFGTVSPRTCPECGLADTVWWQLAAVKVPFEELAERHRATIGRITRERPRTT